MNFICIKSIYNKLHGKEFVIAGKEYYLCKCSPSHSDIYDLYAVFNKDFVSNNTVKFDKLPTEYITYGEIEEYFISIEKHRSKKIEEILE